jgi:hypothetical protein
VAVAALDALIVCPSASWARPRCRSRPAGAQGKGKGMFGWLVRRALRRRLSAAEDGREKRPRQSVAIVGLSIALGALAPAAARARPGPVLRAHGQTLTWTAVPGHNVYQLLTGAHGRETIRLVVGRRTRPRAIPGLRVIYRVKAAHDNSRWSNAVVIRYRRARKSRQPAIAAPPPPGALPPLVGSSPLSEPPGKQEPSSEGRPKYRLDANTNFDPFATARYAPWVRANVSLIKGYPPFSDLFVGLFGLPVIGYHDPATEGQAPLAPAGIDAYISRVRLDMGLGYAGVFVDDANWSAGFNPSPGPRASLANLIEAIRSAEPGALIEMNSQYHDIWQLMKAHDPNVERALRYVNIVTKEFGVGPTAGINSAQDYGEFMQYVDTLHAKGIHTTMTGDNRTGGTTVGAMEYNLATYFLINDGSDFVNGVNQLPTNIWPGFAVNLGAATTHRERSPSGVWTRRFTGGVVYTVEPGAATQTIKLGKPMHSAEWGTVESVTLAAKQGAVLVG